MPNKTLATEMLRELKKNSIRWFVAFLVVLVLWFATIGILIWYVSLPVEETTVTQEVEGNSNQLIGIGNVNGSETNDLSS